MPQSPGCATIQVGFDVATVPGQSAARIRQTRLAATVAKGCGAQMAVMETPAGLRPNVCIRGSHRRVRRQQPVHKRNLARGPGSCRPLRLLLGREPRSPAVSPAGPCAGMTGQTPGADALPGTPSSPARGTHGTSAMAPDALSSASVKTSEKFTNWPGNT